jgi:elongation factor Ts
MDITAKMVQDLRERSGAPLMDCKRALAATQGDVEQAFDHLRKAGLKTADKKAGRSMGSGRVASLISPGMHAGAIVSLACETDFVANTDEFGVLVEKLCAHALKHRPANEAAMLAQKLEGASATIDDTIKGLVGKIGENMQLARAVHMENNRGRVGGYVHHNHRVAALISITSDAAPEKIDAFIKQLGMHVVASKPLALTREEVPADVVEREKTVYRESDELKGKPADRIDKILTGKLDKFFAGAALIEQPWVLDPASTVAKALAAALGPAARIERFALVSAGA